MQRATSIKQWQHQAPSACDDGKSTDHIGKQHQHHDALVIIKTLLVIIKTLLVIITILLVIIKTLWFKYLVIIKTFALPLVIIKTP